MFPINLNLKEKLVLVVGAGRVGKRKLAKLIAAGARVRLVEPRPDGEIKRLAESGQIELLESFRPEQLEGASLVFAASGQPEHNRLVAEEAKAKGLWCNIADSPEQSGFILPAVVERGRFQVAVTTGGASPALAAKVAADLRLRYGPEYGRLTALLSDLRPLVLSSELGGLAREKIFKQLAASEELLEALLSDNEESLAEILAELIRPLRLPPDFKI